VNREGINVGAAACFARRENSRVFLADLASRLHQGSHLILYGPRGAGKSTFLSALGDHYHAIGVPCGIALHTSELPDIVAALLDAYPETDVEGLGKRAAGTRLRAAADLAPGVLLLDHANMVTTAMLGYLRRLRGGAAGALLVVDIDSPRERDRMRGWHVGALSIRMPLMTTRQLHRSFLAATQMHDLPPIERRIQRYLVRLAHGRIGWIAECVRRLQAPEYWRDDRLHVAALCMDTEIAIRQSRIGPSMLRRRGSAYLK
jgi:energy-coupling factor transporter ATP-binding protein EcfA2